MTPANLVPRIVLACALLSACSASTGPDAPGPTPTPGAGAVANPGDPSATAGPSGPAASPGPMAGGAIGTPPPASAPPTRPAPQSTIRSCGTAKTTVNALATHAEWGGFAPVAIGSSVLSMVPFQAGAKTVDGSATRISQGTLGNNGLGGDVAPDVALYLLGFLAADELGDSRASNYGAGGPTQPTSWYVTPSPTTLTFFEGSSVQEISWSIDSPTRTGEPAQPTDSFVRGIVGGSFFGFELVLSFPSECAVGALSDALHQAASLRDAVPTSGIFTPGVTADVQAVLVANDVVMQARVIGNKPLPAVDALLASTTCSPSKIADCATLVTALQAAAQSFQSSPGSSDLTALQADTDARWSPVLVDTAQISIVGP
jgi:hypothetical protein